MNECLFRYEKVVNLGIELKTRISGKRGSQQLADCFVDCPADEHHHLAILLERAIAECS